MKSIVCLLFVISIATKALAEPISFGFLREGLGYQTVDKPQLLNLLPADTLYITTESGREFPITVTRFSRSFHGNLLVSGSTFSKDIFSMVVTPSGEIFGSLREDFDFYRLAMVGDVASINLRDASLTLRPADEAVLEVEEAPSQQTIDLSSISNSDSSSFSLEALTAPVYRSDKATVDVIMYYDEKLPDHEVVMDYVVELGNRTLANAGTGTEIRIVATASMTIPDEVENSAVVEFLQTDESVANNRAFYKADLAHAIRARTPSTTYSGNCGLAPYSVKGGFGRGYRSDVTRSAMTLWDQGGIDNYFCSDLTFIHEIGHNLGSAHDRDQCGSGGCNGPAYPYSYGKREPGAFKTAMAYGSDREYATFSSPLLNCGGFECGDSPSQSSSADNARSIFNTRYLVSGFEGQEFHYESVQEWSTSQTCSSDIFKTFEGILLVNSSSHSISIRGARWLRNDGTEYASNSFESGKYVVRPGEGWSWGWCDGPPGEEVREGFLVYENPVTGALVEGRHVYFDDDYSGNYSTIKVASSAGGSVVGHPAVTARSGDRTIISFTPNAGFALVGVTGSCTGSVKGNTFTIQSSYGDCTAVPQFQAIASSDSVFRVSLEEPVAGNTYTGIRNLRGWALASSGIEKLEVFIDGVYQFDIPHGGNRGDVGNIFPDVQGSSNSGFSMAYGYSNLTQGEHVAKVRATSRGGSVKESSSSFFVTKFHKPFIGAGDVVNLSGGSCQISGDTMSVVDALIDGRPYDLELQWRTAAQDFEIIQVK